MSVVVEERMDSRQRTKGDSPTTVLRYNLHGSDDDTALFSALLGGSPSTYDGLPRRSYAINPVGPSFWIGEAVYRQTTGVKSFPPPGEGDVSVTFDTTGGTAKTYFSKATVSAYGSTPSGGATIGDNGNLINCTQDTVEGTEVVVPQFAFQRTLYIDAADMSSAYIERLYLQTGTTNSGGWTVTFDDGQTMTFAGGEALFMGARGGKQGGPHGDLWEVAQYFAAQPNATALTVGGIAGIAKKGWEYLWVRYLPAVAGALGIPTQKAVAAYVERVYDASDFGGLEP